MGVEATHFRVAPPLFGLCGGVFVHVAPSQRYAALLCAHSAVVGVFLPLSEFCVQVPASMAPVPGEL
jgi:hypothetical protein